MGKSERRARRQRRITDERIRYRQMLDALPDPVIVTNQAHHIVAHNERADHLLFHHAGDSVGRRRAVSLNNVLFSSFVARGLVLGDAGSAPRELSLADPATGNDLLFEVLSRPVHGALDDGAVVSVLHDVTDLRHATTGLLSQVERAQRAEAEARAERDRLNLVLENVADPILVTDPATNTMLMNQQAEELFHGRRPAEAIGAAREDVTVGSNDTKVTSFISEFALTGDSSRRERLSLQEPETKAELPVEVVSGKVFGALGDPIAIVSVFHDLRKQVENERLYEALKSLNSELEQRVRDATQDLETQNEQLKWQSEELARANRLKTEFLASMSHELRTPLNAVIGYASLMLDGVAGSVSHEQREFLDRTRLAAQHLLTLINDLLDLTRIDAGKMPLRIEAVDVPTLVREVAQQVEPPALKKGLRFVIVPPPPGTVLTTDRTRLNQILLNLLSNAVKFTNEGEVRLEVARTDDAVSFSVCDTGIGIRPEDLHKIWEDFRQLDASRTRAAGGTGLGLAITKRLAQRLGATIQVHSEYGQGTTFVVSMPLTPPPS